MVLTDKNGLRWKGFVTGWAFVECMLFGGLVFGWASLNYVLKSEGIYADLCPQILPGNETQIHNETITEENQMSIKCKPQDSNMALCFTISIAMLSVGCVVMGEVMYKWGTRVARIITFPIFTSGTLMTAFISKENPWLMFPGVTCYAIGGISVLITNIQVSNLFVKGSSTVVGLLNGGFDTSSSVVMLLVKIASENGFSRQNMFFLITALHCLTLVSTFFFLPKDVIIKQSSKPGTIELVENVEEKPEQEKGATADKVGTDVPSLRRCVFNPMYLTHVMWLSLLQLRYVYFIGTLNPYLGRMFDEDGDTVNYFTNVCYYTMIGGLVISIYSGSVYDWQKVVLKDGKSERYRKVAPAALPLGMTSLLALLMSILVLIPDPSLLYVTFIVMTFKRAFLFSNGVAFLNEVFPAEYVGVLYGIMIFTGGVIDLLLYAFFTWAEAYNGGALHADICLLVLVCVSFIHPVYLWISSWREETKVKALSDVCHSGCDI